MPGKAAFTVWRTTFEIDAKYQPIKAIGKGAYGVVCSAKNSETGEKVGGGRGAGGWARWWERAGHCWRAGRCGRLVHAGSVQVWTALCAELDTAARRRRCVRRWPPGCAHTS